MHCCFGAGMHSGDRVALHSSPEGPGRGARLGVPGQCSKCTGISAPNLRRIGHYAIQDSNNVKRMLSKKRVDFTALR